MDAGLTETLLASVGSCGLPALGAVLLLGPLGLPIPTGLLLLAGGALARQGLMAWPLAAGVALLSTMVGDTSGYAVGRAAGRWWGQGRPGSRRRQNWQTALAHFRRRGGCAVYVTRFLLTALDVPTNLIAGGSGYPVHRFLAWDAVGRLTWIGLYGGAGYLLGSQWPAAAGLLNAYSSWLAVAVGLAGCLYAAARLWRRKGLVRG